MHLLQRVVLQNYKLNVFAKLKQLNSPPIRQYSINLSPRYSRTILDKSVSSARTLRTLMKYELPTSFACLSKSFATSSDNGSENDSDDEFNESKFELLPATVTVPEVWPHLPAIATKKHPIFPRFMKIIEVNLKIE